MDSLRKRIPVLMAVALLPVLLFTFLTLWQSGRQMREQVISTNEAALDFYTDELEQSLDHIQSYLLNLSLFNTDLSNINNSDHNVRMITRSKLFEKIQQDFILYDADCIFIYAPEYDGMVIMYSSNITYQEMLAFRKELARNPEAYLTRFDWAVGMIADMPFLYQINCSNAGGYLYGALYDISALQSRMEETTAAMHVYLTGTDCQPLPDGSLEEPPVLYSSDKPYRAGEQTVLQSHSDMGFIIWQVFPIPIFLSNGNTFFTFMVLLALFVISLLFFVSLQIYRWMLHPLNGIVEGMSRLAAGNFDYRIHLPQAAWEFRQVGDIFNRMAAQIKDLKIQVYEEQLHRQESELNFLYMQMRPHFFLNALTTVQNFVKLGQYENMYDFTGYLGRYIRYSLRRHTSDVTLSDELDHIENYVGMQNLQHPDSVLLMADVTDQARSCAMPAFIVYTFVENCIKHALSMETMLSIFISAQVTDGNLYLAVEDDSTGFPEEFLKKFNDPSWLEDPGEKHIGIRNVKRTLHLLYGDKATLRLSNAVASGARVELLIPFRQKPTEEDGGNP